MIAVVRVARTALVRTRGFESVSWWTPAPTGQVDEWPYHVVWREAQ